MKNIAKIIATDPAEREAATAIRAQIMAFAEAHAAEFNASVTACINIEFDTARHAATSRISEPLALEKELERLEEARARRLKHLQKNGGAASLLLNNMKLCTNPRVWLEKYPNGITRIDGLLAMHSDPYAFRFKPTRKELREEYKNDVIARMESFRERLRNFKGVRTRPNTPKLQNI